MPVNDGVEYGATDKGFIAPRYATWRAWCARRAVERFGKNARTESTSRLGWIIDRIAWGLHVVFEGAEGAYNAAFYGTARGVDLDKKLAEFAFARLGERESTGELVLWGTNLTVVPQGSRIATEDTGQAYETDGPATIGKKAGVAVITAVAGTGAEWVLSNGADDFVYVELVDDGPEEIARGLAAAMGVQATYSASYLAEDAAGGHMLVVDSTGPDLALGLFVPGDGAGTTYDAVRSTITAADVGPTPGFAGTINDIRNPVFGWTGATNQRDVKVGRNTELDAEYRARWDRERFGPGKATEKAMKRALQATEELRAAILAIRIDEVPTQHFTVLIHRPDASLLSNDQVAQIIWDNKPLGVATEGNTSGTAIDEEGESKTVEFSLATVLYVWIKITITKGEKFPTIGDPATAIAREVATWGNGGPSPARPLEGYVGLGLGDDLERFQMGAPIDKAVPGVKNAAIEVAAQPFLEPPPAPGDYQPADYSVASDTVLVFDSSRISVTVSP